MYKAQADLGKTLIEVSGGLLWWSVIFVHAAVHEVCIWFAYVMSSWPKIWSIGLQGQFPLKLQLTVISYEFWM